MSLLANEVQRAIDEVNRALKPASSIDPYGSPVFTWNGADYICITATSAKGKRLEPGGFIFDNDLLLTLKTSAFINGFPKPSQTLTFKGDPYRIESIKTTGDGSATTLACNAAVRAS